MNDPKAIKQANSNLVAKYVADAIRERRKARQAITDMNEARADALEIAHHNLELANALRQLQPDHPLLYRE